MEKILRTTTDYYGEEIPIAVLKQERGILYLWEVNCLSSSYHNLGNCRCISHPATTKTIISTDDVIVRFGIEALSGFEAPGRKQLIFDAFGVEVDELETYLRVSYEMGSNPLPALRAHLKANVVIFAEEAELLRFPNEKPGTIIFIVNSRGEISVREI